MNGQGPQQGVGAAAVAEGAEMEAPLLCYQTRQIRNFRLVVLKEGVVLRGRAQTYYAKQLAQHAVLTLMGLPILANEIEVG